MPKQPVFAEGPEDPRWIIIGEGPGAYEVNRSKPFIGPSGQVVNQVLGKIGVDRSTLWVTNAALCQPPSGADVPMREHAARACSGRLMAELAARPGIPILTLGAVAARAVIPKPVLDAIDPPETIKALKKAQKLRQQPTIKAARARRKAISKAAQTQLKKLLKHHAKTITTIHKVQYRARVPKHVLAEELLRVQPHLERKANEDAIKIVDAKTKERQLQAVFKAKQPKKPKKHKQVKITDICGTLFDVDVDGTGIRPVIPAIHPAALLRGGGASIGGSHTPDMAFVNLMYDAGKIAALASGKDIRLKLNVEYELTDPARAIELFMLVYHSALEEGACSIDLETYVDDPDRHHALMAYMARIKVIGIATKEMAISLAWEVLPPIAFSLLQILLNRVACGFHNGLYDRTVLRAHGYVMNTGHFEDTLLGHHAAFPGNSHRLQVVASQFYGVGPWKSEYRNQEETLEGLALYNAKDTGATHALLRPLAIHRTRTKTERVYELDKKMSDCASRMHLAGMPIDQEINSELLATFSKNVAESRRHVEDIARDPKRRELIWHYLAIAQAGKARKLDPPEFEARYNLRLSAMGLDPDWKWKIGAGKHIAALLQAMGVELHQTTEGGDISTKKDVLESLVGFPIVRDILSFRENDKLLSTFVWAMFDRTDATGAIQTYGFADDRSRIHPIWNVHRITGRWASQWPVVSNVPKDKWKKLTGDEVLMLGIIPEGKLFKIGAQLYRFNDKDNSYSKMTRPNLRRQIRARPGRMFVGFDYAQIEARVIALISGDPFLCAIFAENRDPHIECARIIWPIFDSLDPDTRKQLRENTKNIEYGFLYMAQLDTLHQTMLKAGNLIEKADLAKAINKLAKAMAGIPEWHRSTIARASAPPFEIKDFVIGRRRVWPMGQVEGPEAVNYGVQTAASAIMNTGMAHMMEVIDNYQEVDPIGQFHDAAIFECWEDDVDRLAKDVKLAFEQAYERDGRSIPFGIDVKIGQSWDKV